MYALPMGLEPPSFLGFIFVQDSAVKLADLLNTIKKREKHPLHLMSLAFDEVAKISTQQNVSHYLLDIAKELIQQLLTIKDSPVDVHMALRAIPFKKTPLLLELEKAFHHLAFTSSEAKAKLISASLLARLQKEDIESDASLARARDDFLTYVNEIVQSELSDHEEFKVTLVIAMSLQSHFGSSWLLNFIFQDIFSKEVANEVLHTLEELSKTVGLLSKPVQEEITVTLKNFHRLPCTDRCLSDPKTVIDRLRIASFCHLKETCNEDSLVMVAAAFEKLKFGFRQGEEEPYYQAFLQCVHALVKKAASFSPILPLALFAKVSQNMRDLFTREFTEACFPENFIPRLNGYLHPKDIVKEDQVNQAFKKLEELTERGFDLLQRLYELKKDKLRDSLGFLNKVFSRFSQAQQTDFLEFESSSPSRYELFKIAYCIEIVFAKEKIFNSGSDAILVIESYLTPFRRQLVFNYSEKSVGVCAKTAQSTLLGEGSSKRVTNIMKLPFDISLKPEIRARGLSRVRASSTVAIDAIGTEFEAMTLFAHDTHIVHALSVYEYSASVKTATGEIEDVSRAAIELDKYQHNGLEVMSGKIQLPPNQLAQLIKDFIEGIHPIHRKRCIHGDIKPNNFVFNVFHKIGLGKGNVSIKGAVCDLGCMSSAVVGQPLPTEKNGEHLVVQPDYTLYPIGFTGTAVFTSPEHFGVPNFNGDHFQSEVFSLGVALFAMKYKGVPLWVDIISAVRKDINLKTKQYTNSPAELVKAQAKLKQCVKENIDDSVIFNRLRDKKRAKKFLTQNEEIDLLIHSMLLLDPKERITLDRARLDIRKILISFPPRRKVKTLRSLTHKVQFQRLHAASSAEHLMRMQVLLQTEQLKREKEEKKEKPPYHNTAKAADRTAFLGTKTQKA